jgi:hypothetical protein
MIGMIAIGLLFARMLCDYPFLMNPSLDCRFDQTENSAHPVSEAA